MNLDADTAIVTPRSELEYANLHYCCAHDCDAKARWVIMERTPRAHHVQTRRTAGSVSLFCDGHVHIAEPADEELVKGHARTTPEMRLYQNLADAWPSAVRMS